MNAINISPDFLLDANVGSLRDAVVRIDNMVESLLQQPLDVTSYVVRGKVELDCQTIVNDEMTEATLTSLREHRYVSGMPDEPNLFEAKAAGLSREKLLQYQISGEPVRFIKIDNSLVDGDAVITSVDQSSFSFEVPSFRVIQTNVPLAAYKYVGPQQQAQAAQKVLTGVALVIGPYLTVRPFGCDFNEVVVVPEDADIIAEIEKIKGEGKTIVVVINNTNRVLSLTEAGPLNIVTITNPDNATLEVEQSL